MLQKLFAGPSALLGRLGTMRALDDERLDAILKGVSRSFYLSLAVLPRAVRAQLSVAYLVARAADTVADTEVIPRGERAALLGALKQAIVAPELAQATSAKIKGALAGTSAVAPGNAQETALMQALDTCLAALHRFEPFDLLATERVLDTLLTGMQRDLERFDGRLYVLPTLADLDEHCYFAAGCVGEYWTQITHHHHERLMPVDIGEQTARGVRLGKGLQYVNVLRDTPRDLLDGRCYMPQELLSAYDLTPEDLKDPARRRRGKDAARYLSDVALCHFDAGFEYIEAIPSHERRLRLPVILPLWIGLETLRALRAADDPFDPAAPVKIPRERVYRLMVEASLGLIAEPVLHELQRLRREVFRA
ncbi:MAG: squalene/phytoene synthase family protein [Deltaproteobacteria bacterium]|nr:squalene/phytoene synthase family protein [Deltaproteobacteria bacterium]